MRRICWITTLSLTLLGLSTACGAGGASLRADGGNLPIAQPSAEPELGQFVFRDAPVSVAIDVQTTSGLPLTFTTNEGRACLAVEFGDAGSSVCASTTEPKRMLYYRTADPKVQDASHWLVGVVPADVVSVDLGDGRSVETTSDPRAPGLAFFAIERDSGVTSDAADRFVIEGRGRDGSVILREVPESQKAAAAQPE